MQYNKREMVKSLIFRHLKKNSGVWCFLIVFKNFAALLNKSLDNFHLKDLLVVRTDRRATLQTLVRYPDPRHHATAESVPVQDQVSQWPYMVETLTQLL